MVTVAKGAPQRLSGPLAALCTLALSVAPAAATAAETEARLSLGTALGELPRFGVNLGGRTAWGAEQLTTNVLRNPGLESALDGAVVIVGRVTPLGAIDDSRWTARTPGFWAGAHFEVLSGLAAGLRGQVLDSQRAHPDQPDEFVLAPQPPGMRPGDAIAVQGLQDRSAVPMWWTEGQVTSVAEPRPGSPGQSAARLFAIAGHPAALFHHLDSIGPRAGKLLPVQGHWRLTLWLRAVAPGAQVHLSFGRQGHADWLDRRLLPGSAWQPVEIDFVAHDDGPPGGLMLSIRVDKGEVLVDDVDLGAVGAPTPGGFRPELIDTLRALRPGYLRDWQGQLADSPANRVASPLARRPTRYRPGATELQFAYSLPEFLALCAAVGARPWVVLPATATPDEAKAFGQALAEGWRTHRFDEIVVEHGNEHWNSIFRPAGIADAAVLAEVADRAFAALRAGAGPQPPLHRVIGTQYVNAGGAVRMAALSRQSEGVAVAPYFHYKQEAGDSTDAALDRALHEDVLPLRETRDKLRGSGRDIDVYEVNFHTTGGSANSAQRDAVVTSAASGTALMRRLLQDAALGVRRQAVYTLAAYDTYVQGDKHELVQLFGIARDLAGADHWRPTGQALVALNAIVGGPAYTAECSGSGCGEVTAMAFGGGARWALVSSAAVALRVSWPCTAALAVQASDGSVSTAVCVGGQADTVLAPRAWATAAPPVSPAAGGYPEITAPVAPAPGSRPARARPG